MGANRVFLGVLTVPTSRFLRDKQWGSRQLILPPDPETEELLGRARCGDRSAVEQLLARHRGRLRQMIVVRMDQRLSARIDPSDVVQEALAVAAKRLPEYLRAPPVSFYPWLRRIAWERLVEAHRRHLRARKRSVSREEIWGLSDASAMQLADRLAARDTSPLARLLRAELCARVQTILARLAAGDREILLLRHLEQLSSAECAEVLGVSEEAAKKRYLRAVQRFRRQLGDETPGEAR
jgi:RNA polymerase sigma-70 factor (ECF subfamily)